MLARAMVKAAFGIILFVMGASVASAAILLTVGLAQQVSIVTERGRRAASRARAPIARCRLPLVIITTITATEARFVGLNDGAELEHCAFAPHNHTRHR